MGIHVGYRKSSYQIHGIHAGSRRPALIVGILLVAGIVFAIFAAFLWQQHARFSAEGLPAQAQVTGTDFRAGVGNRNDDYYVTYQFTVNDRIYTSTQSVGRSAYLGLSQGDVIDILYLASDPAQSMLASVSGPTLPIIFAGGAVLWNVIVLVAGAILVVRPWLQSRRAANAA